MAKVPDTQAAGEADRERKAAYKAIHSETKRRGDRRSKSQVRVLKPKAFRRYAAKSERSRTALARGATRAKALGPDLDRVAGTSPDKGAELDALAAMQPEGQAPICAWAAAAFSARTLKERSGVRLARRSRVSRRHVLFEVGRFAKLRIVDADGERRRRQGSGSSADRHRPCSGPRRQS